MLDGQTNAGLEHRDIIRLREIHIAQRNYLLNNRDYFKQIRARNRPGLRQQQHVWCSCAYMHMCVFHV